MFCVSIATEYEFATPVADGFSFGSIISMTTPSVRTYHVGQDERLFADLKYGSWSEVAAQWWMMSVSMVCPSGRDDPPRGTVHPRVAPEYRGVRVVAGVEGASVGSVTFVKDFPSLSAFWSAVVVSDPI